MKQLNYKLCKIFSVLIFSVLILAALIFTVLISSFSLAADDSKVDTGLMPPSNQPKYRKGMVQDESIKYKNRFGQTCSVQAAITRPYNVLNYSIYLDWRPVMLKTEHDSASRIWYGSVEVAARINEDGVNIFQLDSRDLRIDSVFIGQNKTPYEQDNSNAALNITLDKNYNSGDTAKVKIYYTFMGVSSESFSLFSKGYKPYSYSNLVVEERVAFTMGETEDARGWVPCNDRPEDKAQLEMRIQVPTGFNACSNGLLVNVIDDIDSKVYVWKDTTPISTYLMVANASKFKEFSAYYKRVTNPLDSIEVKYYVWEKDYQSATPGQLNAVEAFASTPDIIKFFSEKFIEYPFCKYGMVAVYPFNWGGMEHQTMTTIHRDWLNGNNETGIAHELSHQWFGDLITCKTWQDVWINEGGATWCEALWSENKSGYDYYKSDMLSNRSTYLWDGGIDLPAIYGLPTAELFDNYSSLIYQKASWIYGMLRNMLGDSTCFSIFRGMLTKYAYSPISSEEFINEFKTNAVNPKVPIDVFFDQWLYKAGHPQYNLISQVNSFEGDKYRITVQLEQTQQGTNVPEVFVTPLNLVIFKDGNYIYDTVLNDQRVQQYDLDLSYIPDSIKLDRTMALLELKSTVITECENPCKPVTPTTFGIFPNPVKRGDICNINYVVRTLEPLKIAVFDCFGRKVQELYNEKLTMGGYNFEVVTGDLSAGVYIIKIADGAEVKLFKLIVE